MSKVTISLSAKSDETLEGFPRRLFVSADKRSSFYTNGTYGFSANVLSATDQKKYASLRKRLRALTEIGSNKDLTKLDKDAKAILVDIGRLIDQYRK